MSLFAVPNFWVNYKDLTVLPNPGIMVSKRNYPKMVLFQVCDLFLIYPVKLPGSALH